MLWKVLVPLCLLCLSALAYEEEKDIDYIGKRKLMSSDTENSNEEGEVTTENYKVEDITEIQNQRKDDTAVTESKEKADKVDNNRSLVHTEESMRSTLNTSHVLWLMQNTLLRFYSRNEKMITVKASGRFPVLGPSEDLVILVHGATKSQDEINDFFETLSRALLNETNYNIIGVDWTEYVTLPEKEGHLAINTDYAKLLGVMLSSLFETHFPGFFTDTLNTYYIGEDIGTIPPITFQERFKKPFRYVYGLNPKKDIPQTRYRLSQEHGEVVAILSTNNYPYPYAHKNIYPVPFGAPLSPVHKILAKAITSNGKTATFCPSANYFTHGYCDTLPHVPVWFMHSHASDRFFPTGSYYFYDTPDKARCDSRPF